MRTTLLTRLALLSFIVWLSFYVWLRQSSRIASQFPGLRWPGLLRPQREDLAPHRNSTADPEILNFWQAWTENILIARPKARPVRVTGPAPNTPAPIDPLAIRKPPLSYVQLAEEDVDQLRHSHAQFKSYVDNLDATTAAEELYKGIGVITVAGGEYYGPAIVGINLLRQTGSTLPVEVFLASWDEYEAALCEDTLPALGAKCVVIDDYLKPQQESGADSKSNGGLHVTHYQLKALALILSSFQHVLYIDSDSIPLVDPEQELFSSEAYMTTGLVGWPDFWQSSEHPRFYEIAGLGETFPNDLPASTSEAGQLLLNKVVHLKTLLLAAYYNVWGPEYYYPLLSQGAMGEGDKETFTTAAYVLKQPYYRVKTPVKSIGRKIAGIYKGTAMVQWHPIDDYNKYVKPEAVHKRQVDKPLGSIEAALRPAFVHSNTPKMNAGHLVDEGDLEDESTGKSLRLWGPVAEQQAIFGDDLEKRVWLVLVRIGCELENTLKEWRGRKNLCKRLKKHWLNVFEVT
ncbi:uncharacterized protein PV09_03973 [Verruconis gallopava]|uniref:Alpha-1,2-mannosyltransferase n=1 Tax=Verruconis gallopava TaxID=253628 RepID=A0A0D2AE94_9PEZI|nr:uncharacterized protein PV09_03973 [Verruconis gallopava]KIW04785.1 hypothetical protein PV09_03973 [Verruconis gallopava]